MSSSEKGCLVGVGFAILAFWGAVSAWNSCWDDLNRDGAARHAREAEERADLDARVQAERDAIEAKKAREAAIAAAAHAANLARYAALTPADRASLIGRLCSSSKCSESARAIGDILPGDDACCSHSQIDAMIESVAGTAEATKLRAAADAVEKRHDAAENPVIRMAKCCDGTESPSCQCPGHQGCCSHHRGVCGCE